MPGAIIALINVGDTTLNLAAAVVPNETSVTFLKFIPVMATVVPTCARGGVNE